MVPLFLNMRGLVVLMTLSSDLHFKTANCKFSRIFRSYFLNKKYTVFTKTWMNSTT